MNYVGNKRFKDDEDDIEEKDEYDVYFNFFEIDSSGKPI